MPKNPANPPEFTPAEVVAKAFRDVGLTQRKFSDALGVSPSTVCRWGYPPRRGCGGRVPGKYHRDVLALAKRFRAKLSARDLIYGR